MKQVSLAEAKATLDQLVRLVQKGEVVEITRDGKPVAQLAPGKPTPRTKRPRKLKPIDIEALLRHRASLTSPPMDTEESLRLWKDDEKY